MPFDNYRRRKMAVTFDVTPVNGGDNTVGSIESVAQLAAYVIGFDSDSDGSDDAPIDLRANDGANGSLYDLALRELQPLMAYAPNDNSGLLHVIVDGHANTAASIARRMEALDGVGTDTTVTAASSITIA